MWVFGGGSVRDASTSCVVGVKVVSRQGLHVGKVFRRLGCCVSKFVSSLSARLYSRRMALSVVRTRERKGGWVL